MIVVGEGQTEETFVRDVLAPELGGNAVFLYPRLIPTSKFASGGALRWDRVSGFLRTTLRERKDTYVTTFFDLYGLKNDFPGLPEARKLNDPRERASTIEERFHAAVVEAAGCRPERFIAHIQPYEFESLIFSGIEVLPEVRPEWKAYLEPLRQARQAAASPEHIDDGPETHPSARLLAALRPRYEKVLHGSPLAKRIGIRRIRAECAHFGAWLSRIETLPPLNEEG